MAVGAALILLNRRIANITGAMNRFSLGLETPESWGRSGAVVVGVMMAAYGLAVLIRLIPLS